MTDLLTRDTDPGPVFLAGTEICEGEVGRELLRRISSGNSLEIWRLRMPAHTDLAGVPHANRTVEHLLVASGRLTAGPTDDLRLLGPGDLLAFTGDAPIATAPTPNRPMPPSSSPRPSSAEKPLEGCGGRPTSLSPPPPCVHE
ncbi:hypothetical protein [Nocardia pseudovaccinii]|uniref:hypothetical protein n=1 Tax=Nocardia pseudovaccinii TaxID=189540 RepID=UPI000AF4EF36|nr:hypothetical protein [Nocardia pseudovaccinii]